MLLLVPAVLCLAATTVALPPSPSVAAHEKLVLDFVHAVTNLDFAAAAQVYADIRTQGHLDVSAFTLAAAIKDVVKSPYYDRLSEDGKQQLETLKKQLPISVRNAVFASTVCLLNIDNFEYLFSPNNDYLNSADSRNVFFWRLGGVVAGSNWTLVETLTPGDWQIVNVYGEYLFADKSHYLLSRRNVYTYLPSEWSGFSTNVWRFIPVGNEVIIQNTWYAGGAEDREYLYAPSNVYNYDANRGRVFTWDNQWPAAGDISNRWHIAAC